jgi:hypothetical protein
MPSLHRWCGQNATFEGGVGDEAGQRLLAGVTGGVVGGLLFAVPLLLEHPARVAE